MSADIPRSPTFCDFKTYNINGPLSLCGKYMRLKYILSCFILSLLCTHLVYGCECGCCAAVIEGTCAGVCCPSYSPCGPDVCSCVYEKTTGYCESKTGSLCSCSVSCDTWCHDNTDNSTDCIVPVYN